MRLWFVLSSFSRPGPNGNWIRHVEKTRQEILNHIVPKLFHNRYLPWHIWRCSAWQIHHVYCLVVIYTVLTQYTTSLLWGEKLTTMKYGLNQPLESKGRMSHCDSQSMKLKVKVGCHRGWKSSSLKLIFNHSQAPTNFIWYLKQTRHEQLPPGPGVPVTEKPLTLPHMGQFLQDSENVPRTSLF